MNTVLIIKASFIVLVSSFVSTSKGLERISAVVVSSNSTVFGVEKIKELSLQITQAGNCAFDIVVLDRNTSPNVKDAIPRALNSRSHIVTVQSEDEIMKWLSRNKPQILLCFAQDAEMPYAVVKAKRKGTALSSDVRIISIMEDVMNFQQKYEKGIDTLEKIATVLKYSDFVVFLTARDQKFLKKELTNSRLDVPLESGVVLRHFSLMKDLFMLLQLKHAAEVDTLWTKAKRIRRDVQNQNNMTTPSSNVTINTTTASPTVSGNMTSTPPSSNVTTGSTIASPTFSGNMTSTTPTSNVTTGSTIASPTVSGNMTSTTPSSNATTGTAFPPSKDDERYVITLEGNCKDVLGNDASEKQFKDEFKRKIILIIRISENEIQIEDLKCGSINVTFIVKNAKKRNTTAVLKKAASEGKITVSVDGKTYKSSGLVVVPLPGPTTKPLPKVTPTTGPDKKLALYLYIAFGAVMGLVFLIGLIVLIVRCRKDKKRGTFSLGGDADVELKRFRGIPRASYYRVEMYGEPVEVDAARSGVRDDEYDGDIVPYAQTTFNSDSAARSSSANNNANKEEFSMGNLPEWKVPKLKTSDVVVSSPKKSSGHGQDEEKGDERDGNDDNDALHAYDNPVMTFGDTSNNLS